MPRRSARQATVHSYFTRRSTAITSDPCDTAEAQPAIIALNSKSADIPNHSISPSPSIPSLPCTTTDAGSSGHPSSLPVHPCHTFITLSCGVCIAPSKRLSKSVQTGNDNETYLDKVDCEQQKKDTVQSEPEEMFVSRLSRRNNVKRRQKGIEKGSMDWFFKTGAEKKKRRRSMPMEWDTEDVPLVVSVKERKKDKELHPFFKSVNGVTTAGKKSKIRKGYVIADAWRYHAATVHVNRINPTAPFFELNMKLKCTEEEALKDTICESVRFDYLYSTREKTCTHSIERTLPLIETPTAEETNTNLWSECAKRDARLDVISGKESKQLIDWLSTWYPNTNSTNHQTSPTHTFPTDTDDSCDQFSFSTSPKHRVAIITGPTGCGKSTIVSNAAVQLGLSVLEINSTTIRTGKKIIQTVKEALSTHRVVTSKSAQSHNSTPSNTLILFEEIDHIHDDERGFWKALHQLIQAEQYRRPIICTATTFTPQMSLIFEYNVDLITADLTRLLLRAGIENHTETSTFRHIAFQARSRKQTNAVVKRVSDTHMLAERNHLQELKIDHNWDDVRHAINQLQFWNAHGLDQQQTAVRGEDKCQVSVVAEKRTMDEEWCEKMALRALLQSMADDMQSVALQQEIEEEEGDDNVDEYSRQRETLLAASIHLHEYSLRNTDEVLEDELSTDSFVDSAALLAEPIPVARRRIGVDYLPYLRTMSAVHSNNASGELCETRPRTRSKRRQGGFYALDLHASTVGVLRRGVSCSFTKSALYSV